MSRRNGRGDGLASADRSVIVTTGLASENPMADNGSILVTGAAGQTRGGRGEPSPACS